LQVVVTKAKAIVGSLVVATLAGTVVFLRARPSAKDELPRPAAIPALLSVLKAKMGRHDLQMRELMTLVVLLDDDGVERVRQLEQDMLARLRVLVVDAPRVSLGRAAA